MFTVPAHLIANLITDLKGPWAVRVEAASFRDGEEKEHYNDFFRLWGRVIRAHYNHHNTITTYYFVEGDDLDLFNIHYPQGA